MLILFIPTSADHFWREIVDLNYKKEQLRHSCYFLFLLTKLVLVLISFFLFIEKNEKNVSFFIPVGDGAVLRDALAFIQVTHPLVKDADKKRNRRSALMRTADKKIQDMHL